MPSLEGVDVSHHNGDIDWQHVKNAGIAFAFIKATDGMSFVDPKALTNLAGCRALGIAPAMYHFYRHDADPAEQAANFLRNIGPRQPGDLPPAIDVEEASDGAGPLTYPASEVVQRIGVFMQAVQAALGVAPVVYTYPAAWHDVTNNSNAFAATHRLWIASYGGNAPKIPGGWSDYTFWQYTDHGSVAGIGAVDRDRFNGGPPELDALCASTLAVGEMAIFNQDGKVHQAPGLSSPVIGVLDGGTGVVIVNGPQPANGRDWWGVDNGEGVVGWSSSKVLSSS